MTRSRLRRALVGCVLAAVALRAARLVQAPFIHADGPGYIESASRLAAGRWQAAVTGYYPPLFPLALRGAHAAGLGWESAGRAVAAAAGIALVPLAFALGATTLGPRAGVGAAALAAVHPQLVRASAEVLPETLYAVLLACWALLVLGPDGGGRSAAAGALGALATTARVEGLALAPLTALAALWPPGRRRLGRAVVAVAAAAVVVVPLLLLGHAATGTWALSGKETAIVARKYGVPASGIAGLVLDHPGAFFARYPGLLARQVEYTLGAVHLLLLVPLAVGLAARPADARAARARALVLVTVAVFTLGIATVNPGKRYAVPLVVLLLPWAALGAVRGLALARDGTFGRMGRGLARRAPAVAALALVALGAEALRPPERATAACHRDVCRWVAERFGEAPPPIMARDGRLAWLCGARFLLAPPNREPAAVAAAARARGAGLWIADAGATPPEPLDGLTRLGERCNGRLVVYAVAPPAGG